MGYTETTATIYVLAPQEGVRFSDDLAVIVKRHGLTPNPGHRTDDHGRTFWVVEANGHWMRLWSTNIPLSGLESVALCGRYAEGGPDPGQYIVTITPEIPFIANDKIHPLLEEIGKELKAAGYEVRQTPVECSPLAKKDKHR